MWGGWFADEKYMEFMKKAREISVAASPLPANSRAEVALLFDEASVAAFPDEDPTPQKLLYDIREALGKTSVPYDLYLTSDYDAIKNNYKAFVLLEPCPTRDSEKIRKTSPVPTFFITPDNGDVRAEELRAFYKESGVWIYSNTDAVIYASESHLFLHTVHDGEQKINLPDGAQYVDLFTGKPFAPRFYSEAQKSYLLQKIN